ncbi:hypothetical protein [Caproiciproducens galactitolivorans]|uniref:Phage major tail protein 2 n=1 Tax=Caproiciproducens galactitolivorans TaxID=642589 RepID=A0ABT4BY22_9FIRM|nr:hypothetical protein [Caproiciproducens galactitolivorans]MCY1715225.1 hypothetical protein [Caproiciproducens galactitolivorans]
MAQNNPSLTPPKTSMGTELWYSTKKAPTAKADLIQIFLVQEIPALESAPESVSYSCLESPNEGTAEGVAKAESLKIPVLYSETQHDALKALSDAKTQIYFWVKLPDSTAAVEGKPLTFVFSGTVHLSNNTISNNGVLQDEMTIFRDMTVTEQKGLPSVT